MKTGAPGQPNSNHNMNWVWISGIAFLISFSASVILIVFGKQLDDLGISGNIYYIVLIPLGFSSAAFLAGAMRSYASFKSNQTLPYGKLSLSGPVVIFALVVVGGFVVPNLNKVQHFDLKLHIIREDQPNDLLNEGTLNLYVGKETKTEEIHRGEVTFNNIPVTFNDKIVKLQLLGLKNYQLADPHGILITKSENYVEVTIIRTKQSLATKIKGSIINDKNEPIKNAFLNFGSGTTTGTTDSNGDFIVTVPFTSGEKIPLKITVNKLILFNEEITISADVPINLKLSPNP
jgi:hypothetical protein